MSKKDKDNQKAPPAQPAPKLPSGEEDLPERVTGFNKELLPLLGKYELGLAAQAAFTPDGRVAANPIIVSARKKPEQPEKEPAAKLAQPE